MFALENLAKQYRQKKTEIDVIKSLKPQSYILYIQLDTTRGVTRHEKRNF